MPLINCSVSVQNSRQACSLYDTHNHSFILPPETCIPLYQWGIFLLSPHILFLITKKQFHLSFSHLFTSWAVLAFSTMCIVQRWVSVHLPGFHSVCTHVVSLFFSYNFVPSDDVHTSFSIPLSGGSLMHEQAPTSAPCGTPLLTSHRYPICIHLSPLSNLSNLSYRVILFCSQLIISLSMPDLLTLSLLCSIVWKKKKEKKKSLVEVQVNYVCCFSPVSSHRHLRSKELIIFAEDDLLFVNGFCWLPLLSLPLQEPVWCL